MFLTPLSDRQELSYENADKILTDLGTTMKQDPKMQPQLILLGDIIDYCSVEAKVNAYLAQSKAQAGASSK